MLRLTELYIIKGNFVNCQVVFLLLFVCIVICHAGQVKQKVKHRSETGR